MLARPRRRQRRRDRNPCRARRRRPRRPAGRRCGRGRSRRRSGTSSRPGAPMSAASSSTRRRPPGLGRDVADLLRARPLRRTAPPRRGQRPRVPEVEYEAPTQVDDISSRSSVASGRRPASTPNRRRWLAGGDCDSRGWLPGCAPRSSSRTSTPAARAGTPPAGRRRLRPQGRGEEPDHVVAKVHHYWQAHLIRARNRFRARLQESPLQRPKYETEVTERRFRAKVEFGIAWPYMWTAVGSSDPAASEIIAALTTTLRSSHPTSSMKASADQFQQALGHSAR